VYNEYLAPLEEKGFLKIPYVSPNVKMSWFVYVIRLADRYAREGRDRVLQGLRSRGIGCSDYFQPIHLQPFYRELGYRLGDLPITEHVAERTIALPFYNRLTKGEVDYVVENLDDILRSID
jgi:perosamine synthetase